MVLIGIVNGIEYWYFDNNDNDKRKVHTYFGGFWNFANNGDDSNLFADYMNHLTNLRAEALAKMPKKVEIEGDVKDENDGYQNWATLNISSTEVIELLTKSGICGKVKVTIEEVQE